MLQLFYLFNLFTFSFCYLFNTNSKEIINEKQFKIIGNWKVTKAEADLSYLGNNSYKISQKEINAFNSKIKNEELGKTICFKRDTIISNLFGQENEIYTQVNYTYKWLNTKKYLIDQGYDENNSFNYRAKTIEVVAISYYNYHLNSRDTLNTICERISDNLIHINFDAKDMYLARLQ